MRDTADAGDLLSAGPPPKYRKRRAWLAALLSILAPGLGQVYNGQPRRAAFFYVMFIGGWALMLLLFLYMPGGAAAILIGTAIFLIAWCASFVDAFVVARGRREDFQLRPYNRWYLYVGLIFLSAFVIQPSLVRAARAGAVEAFRIPNESMAPTIRAGDYILVRKSRPPLNRGTLVVFHPPHRATAPLLKRIVAVPGDTVRMQMKVLHVNGATVPEPYVQYLDPDGDAYVPEMQWQLSFLAPGVDTANYQATRDNWGPLIVPEEQVLVLGDNRDDSEDSRYWGLVPMSSILGYPKRIYFSWQDGICWERVGLDLTRPPGSAAARRHPQRLTTG